MLIGRIVSMEVPVLPSWRVTLRESSEANGLEESTERSTVPVKPLKPVKMRDDEAVFPA